MDIQQCDGLEYLEKYVTNDSVDLVLCDPPYLISRNSGMNTHYNNVAQDNIVMKKTEEQWEAYKKVNNIHGDDEKDNYLRYGTIYGKKYCVRTDYGTWDNGTEFTLDTLDAFISKFYSKLKKSGTLIMFFDIWKITILRDLLEKHGFKQIRFIEWIKSNPQPINSKINYLTNCREIALLGVKGGSPTFNSTYDNGMYIFPFPSGRTRFHPTQKSLKLFEELIKKHSNQGDLVLDTFLGSGTTAIAARNTGRRFTGCEISSEYYTIIQNQLSNM